MIGITFGFPSMLTQTALSTVSPHGLRDRFVPRGCLLSLVTLTVINNAVIIFMGPVPKVIHGDLVGSAISLTGVSATFDFFVVLTSVRFFFLAASSQWSVSKTSFHSLWLLSCCAFSVLALFTAIAEEVILLWSK